MIRNLERSDFRQIFELLKQFAGETGLTNLSREENYDYAQIHSILIKCLNSGINYVAVEDDRIVGFILSIRIPDIWTPRTIYLRELAWFVSEDYRQTSIGARLFHQYKKTAEMLLDSEEIAGFTVSKMANSPDFDYEKRGFKFIEATYMIGD